MISKQHIDEILLAADLLSVMKDNGVAMNKSGSWLYMGNCPFHDEKSGSFFVNIKTQRYYCYGCSESGNAISFLMKKKGVTFVEAVRELAKKCSIIIEEYTPSKEDEKKERFRTGMLEVYKAAASFFISQLEENPKALEYARSRFKSETIELFNIGYAPDDFNALYKHLRQSGFGIDFLEKCDLFRPKKDGGLYDFFRNRLMFPILDITNHIIGFSGRDLGNDPKTPKYLNSSETPIYSKGKTLFALNFAFKEIRKSDCVVLVEGYADAIKLHELGVCNVISSCGTALTDEQIGIIARFTKNFILLYDSDAAGQNAAEKTGKEYLQQGTMCMF